MTPRTHWSIADQRDLAVEATRAGWRIFPWRWVNGDDGQWTKVPRVTGYRGDRPYSEQDVLKFPWRSETSPGVALPPLMIGHDIDVKNGMNGFAHADQLARVYGAPPTPPEQSTPSGGAHRVFRLTRPLPKKVPGRLWLPDGTRSDIDVIHRYYRFLAVYDPLYFLTSPSHFPVLPDEWAQSLVAPASGGIAGRAPSGRSLQIDRVGERIELVATAEQGSRNETLNTQTFLAAIEGSLIPQAVQGFREAALAVGLGADEIERTLASAESAARVQWAAMLEWLSAIRFDTSLQSRGAWRGVTDTALAIAVTMVVTSKPSVGMACRTLAVFRGVSSPAATKSLRRLRKHGYLRVVESSHSGATVYQPAYPATVSSPPQAPRRLLTLTEASQMMRRLALLTESAFQRIGGGGFLPPTAADVLLALEGGPHTLADLVLVTGRSRDALRNSLWLLTDSMGLVSFDGTKYESEYQIAEEAVRQWQSTMGIPDRRQIREERIAKERLHYAERQTALLEVGPRRDAPKGVEADTADS